MFLSSVMPASGWGAQGKKVPSWNRSKIQTTFFQQVDVFDENGCIGKLQRALYLDLSMPGTSHINFTTSAR